MITNLKQTVNSLQTVMIILLILSIQLAVVILYNLTNINVSERVRELSTIKVLGLHNHEVTNYIYRGNGGFVHYRNFCRAAFRQNHGPENPGNGGGRRGDV